jgi:demethylmenaquinone methyltransferase/2-methoxy-6-polyprenyl-1,4-benzoquinol methylase
MRTALGKEELKRVYEGVARRYDFQHALLTLKSDQRGRKLLVDKAVHPDDKILDCGSGTGSTGILAARKAGAGGQVTMFDLSDSMLAVAREKVIQEGLRDRVTFETGDIVQLPFADDSFDVVLSTYSLCPVYDPEKGALELFRVTRPGGRIAIAHSTEPRNSVVKWLADRIENQAWKFPWLSMGCRSVDVLPALTGAGGKVLFSRHIGVPLWPFFVFIVEKPTH